MDEHYMIFRKQLKTAVDELMADPYDDGSYSREEIEAALWDWLTQSMDQLLDGAVDYSHGPRPFGPSFSRCLRERTRQKQQEGQ